LRVRSAHNLSLKEKDLPIKIFGLSQRGEREDADEADSAERGFIPWSSSRERKREMGKTPKLVSRRGRFVQR